MVSLMSGILVVAALLPLLLPSIRQLRLGQIVDESRLDDGETPLPDLLAKGAKGEGST